jgi:hypothetical protein
MKYFTLIFLKEGWMIVEENMITHKPGAERPMWPPMACAIP